MCQSETEWYLFCLIGEARLIVNGDKVVEVSAECSFPSFQHHIYLWKVMFHADMSFKSHRQTLHIHPQPASSLQEVTKLEVNYFFCC